MDLPNEVRGFGPNSDYYSQPSRHGNTWKSLTVVSNAIGQGELTVTPVQMGNMAAMIANKGYYYTPHIVQNIENDIIDEKYSTVHDTGIDTSYFEPIWKGMEMAVWGEWPSTATIARIPNVRICGKTGTAENPHGKDHSAFVAFAPKEDPQIAIAVYVENGGFGATWAAPIASLMVEKYLVGDISSPYRQWL